MSNDLSAEELRAANERLRQKRARLETDGATKTNGTAPVGDLAARIASSVTPLPSPKREDCGCERYPGRDGKPRVRPCPTHLDEYRERQDRTRREQAREQRARDAADHLRAAGFYREHASAQFEDFTEDARTRALAWLDAPEERSGLLVKGPTGTGKTRLAAALARVFVVDGASVQFVTCGDLFARIRASFRDDADETEAALVESLKTVGLLVIDDLGNEGTVTPFVRSVLHRVLSARNGEFCPTIVTTNLKAAEIAGVYGDAIASRLSAWEHLVIDGPDRRARKGPDGFGRHNARA